jgi:hypothetical protein
MFHRRVLIRSEVDAPGGDSDLLGLEIVLNFSLLNDDAIAFVPVTLPPRFAPYLCQRLVRSGADLITVQQLLGHAKIAMTARYAHCMVDDKIAAVNNLDFPGSCSSPDPNRTPGPQMTVPETGAKVLQSCTIGP